MKPANIFSNINFSLTIKSQSTKKNSISSDSTELQIEFYSIFIKAANLIII